MTIGGNMVNQIYREVILYFNTLLINFVAPKEPFYSIYF